MIQNHQHNNYSLRSL